MNEIIMKIDNVKVIYQNFGYITYKYNKSLYFKVAKLIYERFEGESFQYTFEPFYDVLDILKIGIPGIDLSLRRKVYYRSNITPVFISERITPKNRVNLRDELKRQGMDYYQPFLLALDSKFSYSGDKLSLKSQDFFNREVSSYKNIKDLYKNIPLTLKNLAARNIFMIDDTKITDQNRYYYLKIYLGLYKNITEYYVEKNKKSRGRNKQVISDELLTEIRNQHLHGIISINEAISRSGLGSKSTFYRRLKELEKK